MFFAVSYYRRLLKHFDPFHVPIPTSCVQKHKYMYASVQTVPGLRALIFVRLSAPVLNAVLSTTSPGCVHGFLPPYVRAGGLSHCRHMLLDWEIEAQSVTDYERKIRSRRQRLSGRSYLELGCLAGVLDPIRNFDS